MDNVFVLAWVLPGFIFWLIILKEQSFPKETDFRLISVAAILGFLITIFTRLMLYGVRECFEVSFLERARTVWHQILPFPYSLSFFLTGLVAFILAKLYLLCWPERWSIAVLKGDQSALSKRLWELSLNKDGGGDKPIAANSPLTMFQLRNNKIYVGYIISFEVEGKASDNYIEIIPLISGQRIKKTSNGITAYHTRFDTTYFNQNEEGITLKKLANDEPVKTFFLYNLVVGFTQFDPALYANFEQEHKNREGI